MSYEPTASTTEFEHGVIRRLFDSGRVTHGGWCMLGNPFAAEIITASGCDWLVIDQQHGYVTDEAMRVMIQTAGIRGVPVLVRVPWNEPISIGHALDAGAEGVIVPMISTADDARRAADASHYPPLGYRSWGPLRAGMAQPGFDTLAGNAQVICMAMMETAEGVENLEQIIAVPGLDGVLIGPNDLAISHSGTNAGAATAARDRGADRTCRARLRRGRRPGGDGLRRRRGRPGVGGRGVQLSRAALGHPVARRRDEGRAGRGA